MESAERLVVDSRPVQRLRDIHQLAMSYLIYPGATHRRFEHSLGVMHLAGLVFDQIVRPDMLTDEVRELVPETVQESAFDYWRRTVRLAALCHDIGHLPFSHAAEHELLPPGTTHETITWDLIMSDEMTAVWEKVDPPVRPQVIAKLAVGPKKAPNDVTFTPWERLLTEVITSDALGVDRMDYLLRDSLHAQPGEAVYEWAIERFGANMVRHSNPPSKTGDVDFPVRLQNGEVVSSLSVSAALNAVPSVVADTVYIDRSLLNAANYELERAKDEILSEASARQDEEADDPAASRSGT